MASPFDMVSIVVALAVAELLQQRRRRVSQMERHRLRAIGFDLCRDVSVAGVEAFDFGASARYTAA